MKKGFMRQILAFVLVLAMLLPTLADVVALSVSAETTTYGEANVYDIYDLTGSETNTVKGTDATWDGVVIGSVSTEHKENIVFKTKLTMGEQEIRLALNSLEGNSIYDPQGYAVYINHNSGAPYITIKRNQSDLVLGSIAAVAGTWELEIGIVDILQGGVRTGKHLYVKKDGVTVCEVDDTDGYLTGDSLGTRIVDFHYGAAIQMDTTKTSDNTYGTPTVYDIYDLTGSETNTVNGTDATWDGVVIGAVSDEHKENIVFKTKLTMGEQEIRLALNSLEGNSIYDPQGYAVYINHNNGAPYITIKRNQSDLVLGSIAAVAGTWELEIGIVDILSEGVRIGKHLYVKKDGVTVCEVDDTDGYLTGDALGTKIVDFHYGAAIQMDSMKETETTEPESTEPETTEPQTVADATVYDIFDLTGFETNPIAGTGNGNWSATVLGNFDTENKENAALKAVFTTSGSKDAWDNIRLSLGAKESDDLIDPKGYALVISVDAEGVSHIHFNRAGSGLKTYTLSENTIPSSAQLSNVTLEFGYRSILSGETIVGKQLYLAVNGEETYVYNDTEGFLTGDALGTKVGIFHYLNVVTMDTTKTNEKTYGTANVYDIYDLTGSETNTVNGTDATWDGVVIGAVSAEHKENIVFKTKLTMGEQEIRLALNSLEGNNIYDPQGYAVYINHNGGAPYIAIRRNQSDLVLGSIAAVAGTWELEIGIVDILTEGVRTGKHLYVKKDGVTVCEVDDTDGYLTGDALGTKIVDFHYGAAIQMDSTEELAPETTEPETTVPETEPETTEPETTQPGGGNAYGAANVYDIYDLTGAAFNTVTGTGNDNWSGVVLGSVSQEHKENIVFKTKLTMGEQQIRLALNSLEGNDIYDPQGYAVYINHNEGTPYIAIKRNQSDLVIGSVSAVAGTWELEIGILDILTDGVQTGKHLYVKKDGVTVCEVDDTDGYLTGDALGTKIVDFHYGAAIQMDSTEELEPETTEPETTQPGDGSGYGTANIYDIYDLTGSETNTVTGTGNDNWSGVTLGSVSGLHKENIAFKTMLTMGAQEIRLSLNAKDGADIYDPPGYAVYINHNGGAPYISIRRNNHDLAVDSVDSVQGTWELEIGIVDILTEGVQTGKHLYVKKDGVVVCEVDDTDGYLTGDALGTKLVDFHYGAAIQMDTTKQIEPTEPEASEPGTTGPDAGSQTVAEAVVYDIRDLTGSANNTYYGVQAGSLGIPGVGDNWSDSVIGNVKAEDKESITFKTILTVDAARTDGADTLRLSLGLLDNATALDYQGYSLRAILEPTDGKTYFGLYRNGENLAYWEEETVVGTYELEFGFQSILEGTQIVGKRLTVKKDGVVLQTYDDTNGYLTGDALGTKAAIFHYLGKVEMDSTKPSVPQTVADAVVYDIYDLTGNANNTYYGVQASSLGIPGVEDNWSDSVIGNVKAQDKESITFKTKLTVDAARTDGVDTFRLSLGLLDNATALDYQGYSLRAVVEPTDGKTYFGLYRNGENLAYWEEETVIGSYELEFGIQSILEGTQIVGKRLTLKKDGTVLKTHDDKNGYLTGDALGTKMAIFHYLDKVEMDSTKPIPPQTLADATVYDIYDLTGIVSNTVKGTDDTWEGQLFADVKPEHKENVAIKTKLTMGAQQVRLSFNAKEGADIYDPQGYAVYLYGDTDVVEIRRNNATLKSAAVQGVAGTYILEIGMVDILSDGNRVGKHLYVKIDDVVVCEYDDIRGYLTGDDLGTKLIDFHYGAAIRMDTTYDSGYGEAKVYDLSELTGETETYVAPWIPTKLGNIGEADKEQAAIALKMNITDARHRYRFSLGAPEGADCTDPQGYGLEIAVQFDGANYVRFTRGNGNTIAYFDDVSKLIGEHTLEFGYRNVLLDGGVVGKQVYLSVDGEILYTGVDGIGYLTGDELGTMVALHHIDESAAQLCSQDYIPPEYGSLTAADATVYDLYDLAFRETLEVNHKDDNGDVIWGVLIGNVEENRKGNVALKTKVTMSRDRQQNLIIGLGLNGHWPVGGGFGYQIELDANPENERDSLIIYKNATADYSNIVCCYSAEQDFDFNGSFQLEVGVADLTDSEKNVVARRIYVKVDGEELMHFDDTKNMISGDQMGNTVAAYASSGSVTLGTCVDGIPSANVLVYDIFDLLGRATLQLTRTDAGGEVIWSNEIGQITDTNNMSYALRVNMNTSQVNRSELQELIIGLCKDTDLFDKTGYRLSLYFGTDGGTSLVLRDSATDEVLASSNGVFPASYELQIGITDFYDSSKTKVGKKIFVKIDGEEVLSYLDKDANRARGNLMCAYTTSPITMATNYGYTTIPVTYVVNGETVEDSKYVTTNTDVVVGKKSVIDIALGNKDEFTSVILEQVLLNGQPITPVSDKKGVYVFHLENPSEEDQLTVEIQIHNLTVDEAEVYDLYELTGKKQIVIPAYSVDQIGTLFADGQEGVLNRAIRFAYYIPKTGGGLRLGYGSDTSDIWSRTGTHIEIWCGFATISHGFHVSALSSGNTDIFKADSWSIVEVGIVKCYEDGIYKYDRWYVKAGKTLEDMELITYYDSTQRHDSSLNIMARTPDTGDDFILASTLDVRSVTDVSEETAKDGADVAFKPLFLKGESVKIVVFPKEGKTLESLYVNGEKVEAALTSDGGYVFTMENVTEDVEFSYVLSEDERLYNITADDADNVKFTLDQSSVSAGGTVTVQIKVDGGYALKSLLVNNVDFLPMARYDKTTLTYTLTIRDIREDKHIQAQAEKVVEYSPVADGKAEEENKTSLPVVIAVAALSAAVVGGTVVTVVTRARKKGQKQ